MAATLPIEVREMMAERPRRMHHYLWHQVRSSWLRYPPETRQRLSDLGWMPPRPARGENGQLLLDNSSGEDFFYMHRQMIAHVNVKLAQLTDPSYSKVQGWIAVPWPGDEDFPVPPPWEDDEPDFTQFLTTVKSEGFYRSNFASWESFFRNLIILRRMSLGQLGSLLEFTIHNYMHMRWAAQPIGNRPNATPGEHDTIPEEWDRVDYDYLGDTYSSHVNPIFWKLHGWIDNRIEDWRRANGVEEIEWIGTWIGDMPSMPEPAPESALMVLSVDYGDHDHIGRMHDHIGRMEEAIKAIGECGIFHEFYSDGVKEFRFDPE